MLRFYTRPDGQIMMVVAEGLEIGPFASAEDAMRAMRRHKFILDSRQIATRLWAAAIELDNQRRLYEAGYDAGSPEAVRNADLAPHGLNRAQFDAAMAAIGAVADDILSSRRDALFPLTAL